LLTMWYLKRKAGPIRKVKVYGWICCLMIVIWGMMNSSCKNIAPVKSVDVAWEPFYWKGNFSNKQSKPWRSLNRFAHTNCWSRNCMLLTLIVSGPKCRFTKGTAQILLPTAISIVSASQARLSNYQKYRQIQVRNSHEILMETNESIRTLKEARNLWWPVAC
jgi:hypothetical protein